jgi:hypothetical protein
MGKVKVVPVEQEAPVETPQPEVKEESSSEPEVKPEVKTEELAIEAPPPPEPTQNTKKEQTMISCEKCGKSMLMKTFKYSHLKVCKPSEPEAPPPPPPPPPTPEPKAKVKRAPPKPKAENPVIPKPEFNGEVYFSHYNEPMPPPSYIETYRQSREQRQQVRVQRVKSLISQAL